MTARTFPDHKPGDGFEAPKVWWTPSISPGALMIYTGDKFPQWKGDALVGALSGEALIRVDIDGDKATQGRPLADGRAHPGGRPGAGRQRLSCSRMAIAAGGCSGSIRQPPAESVQSAGCGMRRR